MSAVTYPAKSFSLPRDAALVSVEEHAKGFLGRMFNAVMATRAAQAEREVARHLAFRGLDFRDPHL